LLIIGKFAGQQREGIAHPHIVGQPPKAIHGARQTIPMFRSFGPLLSQAIQIFNYAAPGFSFYRAFDLG
jgi:hypothetical protein